jgi:hypothetical protein
MRHFRWWIRHTTAYASYVGNKAAKDHFRRYFLCSMQGVYAKGLLRQAFEKQLKSNMTQLETEVAIVA